MQLLPRRKYSQHDQTSMGITLTKTPSVSKFYVKAPSLIETRITRETLSFQSNEITGERAATHITLTVK